MNTLITASRTILPPQLELRTLAPTLDGEFAQMQTAATIGADHPFSRSERPSSEEDHMLRLEPHEIPFEFKTDNVGKLALDFTNNQLLPNLTPEELKKLIDDFYRLVKAMGSIIVIKHGPGMNKEISSLLSGV